MVFYFRNEQLVQKSDRQPPIPIGQNVIVAYTINDAGNLVSIFAMAASFSTETQNRSDRAETRVSGQSRCAESNGIIAELIYRCDEVGIAITS